MNRFVSTVIRLGYYECLTCVYTCLVAFLNPLYFHNGYSDINTSKYRLFIWETIVTVMLLIAGLLYKRRKIRLVAADWMALAFLFISILSCILSAHPYEALTGSGGRWTGLCLTSALTALYFIVSRSHYARRVGVSAFLAGGTFCSLLGVMNFFHIDPLGFYSSLQEWLHPAFISTIGHHNFFSAYLCMFCAVASGVIISVRDRFRAALGAIALYIGFCGIYAARSDSSLLALCMMLVILTGLAFRSWVSMKRVLLVFDIFVLAALTMGTLTRFLSKRCFSTAEHILCRLSIPELCVPVLVMLVTLRLLVYGMERRHSLQRYRWVRSIALSIWILFAVLFIGLLVYWTLLDRQTQLNGAWRYFRINDAWGNYRGYIWKNTWMIFRDMSWLQKLFGCGPDTLRYEMMERFGTHTASLIGVSVDNAHNEYLQYLVTTGVLGLLMYMGFLFCVLCPALKHIGHDQTLIAPMLGSLCYMAQAILNINQPITLPLFYLLLALIGNSIEHKELINSRPLTAPCVPFGTRHIRYRQFE